MPNNEYEILKNLKAIKFLLAGILLNRKPNVKEVAKIINCSDNALTAMYPDKMRKDKKGSKEEAIQEKNKEEAQNDGQ